MKALNILIITVLAVLLVSSNAFSQPETPDRNPTYTIVEEMPMFPGCEESGLGKTETKQCAEKKMLEFIYSNVVYPEQAIKEDLEGMVVVSFVVDKDGAIINPTVVRSVGGGCDEEVLRIVGEMPIWIPGKQKGEAVKVKFNLPVRFQLEDDVQKDIDDSLRKLQEDIEYEGLSLVFCEDFAGEFFNATDLNQWADTPFNQKSLCGYNSSVVFMEMTYVENNAERTLESEGELTNGMRDYFRNAKPGSFIRIRMRIVVNELRGSIIKVLIIE